MTPTVGLDATSRAVVSAFASLAVAFTMIRFGIARHDRTDARSAA